MRKMMTAFGLMVLLHGVAAAQVDSVESEIFDLSLEDLLKMEVSVSSKTKETTREAAGIVSVVTHEDIHNNQCRDLNDVFNLIAGFNLAKDEDYGSVFSRGLYGYEGRMLFMVDGMQISDLYFGAYNLGNDFPIHIIERIEVIRGPGSVLYGGTAELAVVNIITTQGAEMNGGEFNARYGRLPSSIGHHDMSLNYGRELGPVEFSLLASHGQARRSDAQARYTSRNAVFDHNQQSAGLENTALQMSLNYKKNTSLGVVFQRYSNNFVRSFSVDPILGAVSATDQVYTTLEEGIEARKTSYNHTTLSSLLSHRWQVNDKLSINPALSYQYSYPYERNEPRDEASIQRLKPSVHAVYEQGGLNLTAGGEYFIDMAKVERHANQPKVEYLRVKYNDPGSEQLNISNLAGFANARYKLTAGPGALSLNLGARYDYNQLYGQRLSPRVGLNWVGEKFHTKLLASSAFRAPLVANNAFSRYGLNPDPELNSRPSDGVRPEDTQVYELEVGYLLAENLFWATNVFYQKVNHIIEYRYNSSNKDLYSDNGGSIATYGLESELKYRSKRYHGMVNVSTVRPEFFDDTNPFAYSYLAPKGGDTYITPDNDNGQPTRLALLGVPELKIYTNHHWRITPMVGLTANMLYLSPKYAYVGNAKSTRLSEQWIAGMGISILGLFDMLDIDLRVHDLLNQRLNIVSAWYDSQYATLPYKGREISVHVVYTFGAGEEE